MPDTPPASADAIFSPAPVTPPAPEPATLPAHAPVVVIGGGIAGCSAAYYLAKRGVKALLLDKGSIAHEQSSRAWGFVRQQDRDPAELPLMVAGNRIWRELEAELGADIEWTQGGILAMAKDEADLGHYETRAKLEREAGADSRMLTPGEVAGMLPQLALPVAGALHTPSDGHADPGRATLAMADAARRAGADLRDHCPVNDLRVEGGRVTGVVTPHGEVRTDAVICAAGAHSSRLLRRAGLDLPVRTVRSTVAVTRPIAPFTKLAVRGLDVAFRQTRAGNLILGRVSAGSADYDITLESFRHLGWFLPNYFENRDLLRLRLGRPLLADLWRAMPWSGAGRRPFDHTVDAEPRANQRTAELNRAAFERHFPALGPVAIERTWAGIIDTLPDILPVVGESDLPGLYVATGFSGHGFAMGPIVGQLLAALITEGSTFLDLHPLRFSRFREGDRGRARPLR